MSLHWLRYIKESFSASTNQTETLARESTKKILFIGFGAVPNYKSISWKDRDWPNAADYDAVFMNLGALYNIAANWKVEIDEGSKNLSDDVKVISKNLSNLRDQTLQLINSDRMVFVFASPHFHVQAEIDSNNNTRSFVSFDTYSWCPLPINVNENEGGSSIRTIDDRFVEYSRNVKEWIFIFDDKPQTLDYLSRNDLPSNKLYVTIPKPLFVNLSMFSLGIELRYGIVSYDGYDYKPEDTTSGPIFLLHFPINGDIEICVNSLLLTFFNTRVTFSEEPEWLNSITPPRCKQLDDKITVILSEIDRLQQEQILLAEERKTYEHWLKLLYETGNNLENIVLEALKIIGLENARPGVKAYQDIIGEKFDSIIVFEVKGLTKTAGRGEVFSLDRHVTEYETSNPNEKVRKGVLISNSWRALSPALRDVEGRQVFAGDAINFAKQLDFVLLDTRILYQVITDVLEDRLVSTDDFWRSLINTTGVYVYKM